jgi:hypothetical protein
MIRNAMLALSSLAFAGILSLVPAPAAAQRTVTCESRGHDRTRCSVDTRGGVRLVQQLSEARCERGRSWGADERGIWVSRGCRARFSVGGRDRWDDRREDRRERREHRRDRHEDRWERSAARERAERLCHNAVRARYRTDRRDVRTDFRSVDRFGDAVVAWSTDRLRGACTVTPAGRVASIRSTGR